MTVWGKGWEAEKLTTGSSYIALRRDTRKTPLLAVTLQLDDITVGANRTENTIHSGVLIIMRVTAATPT
jgi:hypothetical protein